MAKCPDCDGTSDIFGLIGNGRCSVCHGDGKALLSGLNEAVMGEPLECWKCGGSGTCQTCNGSGEID